MEQLHLRAAREVWERYQSERSALARRSLDLQPLVDAWERSSRLGAPLEGPPDEEHLISGAALRQRCEPIEPLLVLGSDVLDHTARALHDRDHLLLVADPDGIVAHTIGGGAFAREARRLRLIEGATWSEAARGTNAIGTALTTGLPTTVHGAAHYGLRFHDLVCHAAPIRAPDGQILAVLDATSRTAADDRSITSVIRAAALAIEALLRARAWSIAGQSARNLVERTLDSLSAPGMLVEPSGLIVRCNAPARAWLGPEPLPRSASEALGFSFEALAREASGRGGLSCGSGARTLRLRVEPLCAPDGSLVALALLGELPELRVKRSLPPLEPAPRAAFSRIFAEDPDTQAAITFASRVACSDLSVLLLSETGSGKELFAEAIHEASPRKAGPFVPINCGSLSPQLLESELFGYGPGAFTGADRSGRDGLLQSAHGGTLFLDEVAEMPPSMQTALLRVLESGQYYRVGERVARRVDVRIVAATCRDLASLVAQGTFRQDLYYRLKSVIVSIPPLRKRADRLALAWHLLGEGTPPMSPALERFIERYPWPGNVREMKAVMAVVRLLGEGERALDITHLPPDLASHSPQPDPSAIAAAAAPASLADVELRAVQQALSELGGNVSAAARKLGIARSTIYRMLKR